jgi:MFS family permease
VSSTTIKTADLSLTKVLLVGGLIVSLAMGIRHGFGLFNLPVTQANGWGRETFALAIALQNLVWGITQPIFGGLADRFGSHKVMVLGGVLYTLGLIGSGLSTSSVGFVMTTGVVLGLALACTTYSVVYGVIGRNCPPEKRVWAMGIAAAMGSFGQFLMIPVEQELLTHFGIQNSLIILAILTSFILPLSLILREKNYQPAQTGSDQTIVQAIKEAFGQRSFQLLIFGYLVCGFQVIFIGAHLVPYLKDMSATYPDVGRPEVATIALALVGLFNIFGTYFAGKLGQTVPKHLLLAYIYGARAIVIAAFILLPLSPVTAYLFAAFMGFLWLSTVPLTNGIVAHIFGVKYLSMLSGFAFFSHQIGGFMGAYFGGYLFDVTGSYNIVWIIAIGLSILAALVNIPIKEEELVRVPQGSATATS